MQFLQMLSENQLLWWKIAVPSTPPLLQLEFAFLIPKTMGAAALEFPWMCKAPHTPSLYIVCVFICSDSAPLVTVKGSTCKVCSFHHRPLIVLKLAQKLIH